YGRVIFKVEAAEMSTAGVGDERNVSERERIANEIWRLFQLQLHARERGVALDQQRCGHFIVAFAEIMLERDAHRYLRLMAVLLPEQPLIHLGAIVRVGRDEIRALAE